MALASRLLDEITDEEDWSEMISLIVGNLAGHAYIMIRRHEGEEVAEKWLKMTESVRLAHIAKDPTEN